MSDRLTEAALYVKRADELGLDLGNWPRRLIKACRRFNRGETQSVVLNEPPTSLSRRRPRRRRRSFATGSFEITGNTIRFTRTVKLSRSELQNILTLMR